MIERWKKLKTFKEKGHPFLDGYIFDDGSKFLLEPQVYTQLEGFRQQYPERMDDILDAMENVVHKNHFVVFIMDDEESPMDIEDAIYRTVIDVTDVLHIFVEDKSRGSDYGD